MGDLLLLGPEGDRLDFFATTHGIAASLALSLSHRRLRGDSGRGAARQQRALAALATALARAFGQGDAADIGAIVTLMARAQWLECRGVPHDELIALPRDWPLCGLPANPAALALAAVIRLRIGLENALIAGGIPERGLKRAAQLRTVRDLEAGVLATARDLERNAIMPATAIRRLHPRFAAAECVIGSDLLELLGGAEAIDGAIMATIGAIGVRYAA